MAASASSIPSIFGGLFSLFDGYTDARKGTLTDLKKANIANHEAALAIGLAADGTPMATPLAITASYAALTTQTEVLIGDVTELVNTPLTFSTVTTCIGDVLGAVGDAVDVVAAAANANPKTKAFGMILNGIGNDLTIAGIALSDTVYAKEVFSTAWDVWGGQVKSALNTALKDLTITINTSNNSVNSAWTNVKNNISTDLSAALIAVTDSMTSGNTNLAADCNAVAADTTSSMSSVATLATAEGFTGSSVNATDLNNGLDLTDASGTHLDFSSPIGISDGGTVIESVTNVSSNTSESIQLNSDGSLTTYTYSGPNDSGNKVNRYGIYRWCVVDYHIRADRTIGDQRL